MLVVSRHGQPVGDLGRDDIYRSISCFLGTTVFLWIVRGPKMKHIAFAAGKPSLSACISENELQNRHYFEGRRQSETSVGGASNESQ